MNNNDNNAWWTHGMSNKLYQLQFTQNEQLQKYNHNHNINHNNVKINGGYLIKISVVFIQFPWIRIKIKLLFNSLTLSSIGWGDRINIHYQRIVISPELYISYRPVCKL